MIVVFAAGGTGGHLYPAIAIADALASRGNSVTFIGSADRLETTLVPRAGYTLHPVCSGPLTGSQPLALLRTLARNAWGIAQSLRLLLRLRPDVLVATGGYVCFPVVAAARILRGLCVLRGPIALLEPNARTGLTNRLLAPLADEVWGAFENSDGGGRYVRTGVPVRASLRALPPRPQAAARLGLDPARRTLVAFGGSQGARSLNEALVELLTEDGLPPGWQLLHLTGEREYDRVRDAPGSRPAAIRPYLHDLADAYAVADLVVARAGASTLGELAATGTPAILVPYPHAAADHQRANAESFERAGAAVVLADAALKAGGLRAALAEATRPETLARLRAAAGRMRGDDPLATILARVEALVSRKQP